MTGYGKAVVAYKDKKINVEVKSLNSKQLDLQTRIALADGFVYNNNGVELLLLLAAALEDREHHMKKLLVLLKIKMLRPDMLQRNGDHFRID